MSSETEIERLVVRLVGDATGYSTMMQQAGRAVEATTNQVQHHVSMLDSIKTRVSQLASSLTSFGPMLAGALGIGSFAAASVGAITLASDLEKTTISFETMLGSASKARMMLENIRVYAAQTPFEQAPLRQSAQMLMNYGIAAERIMPTLKMLGDVSAGDQNKLNGLAYAFAQMTARGKIMGDDLRQMINWGFNPLQEMARTSGKSMSELTDMMHKGQVTIDMLNGAFKSASSEGGRFFGMMEKQSKSLYGLFSTLKDEISLLLTTIGQELIKKLDLKKVLENLITLFQGLTSIIREFGGQIVATVVVVGSFLTSMALIRAATMLYSLAIDLLIKKQITSKALMGPKGWAELAISLGIAAIATGQVSGAFSVVEKEARKAAVSVNALQKGIEKIGAGGEVAAVLGRLEGVRERLVQLQNVAKFQQDLGKGLAARDFKAANLIDILGLKEFDDPAKRAADRIMLLGRGLLLLKAFKDILPVKDVARLTEMIDRERNVLSGVTEQIANQRKELQKLKEATDPAIEAARLRAEGAGKAAVEELMSLRRQTKAIQDQREALEALAEAERRSKEELKNRAKSLTESVMTDIERFKSQVTEIYQLFNKGLISKTTRDRAIEQAMELGDTVGKTTAEAFKVSMPFDAAIAGSRDASQHLAEYAQGLVKKPLSTEEQKKQQLQQQANAELAIIRKNMEDMNKNLLQWAGEPVFKLEFDAANLA